MIDLDDKDPLVDTLWVYVRPIINDCARNMRPFLDKLGVSEDELSPFCREFDSVAELLGVYNGIYSRTKKTTAQNTSSNEGDVEDQLVEGEDECEDDDMECLTLVNDSISNVESAINKALDRAEAAGNELVTVEVEEGNDPFSQLDKKVPLLEGLRSLLTAEDVDEMTNAAREGIAMLPVKNKGSVSYGRKHKSLKERWISRDVVPVSVDEDNPGQVFVERNTQVKIEVKQGRGKKAKKAVKDFRVLALFTKSYNKWYLCEKGKQSWKKDMEKGKFRVLMRMVEFDHSMGKYYDVKPSSSAQWETKCIYVVCDANAINHVVQHLGTAV